MRKLAPGSPETLGVTLDGNGANVAVFSAHAQAIELCLFDAAGETEVERIALPERTGEVFHGYIAGIRAGDRYGLRAHGPYDPANGHRFNAAKLLIDPYARALDRRPQLHPSLFGEQPDGITRNDDDSAPHVPKAVVTAAFDRRRASRRAIAWPDTVLYELHVRGFTRAHPGVPEPLRGTLAGLAHPAALEHLSRLGITTIELMPLAATLDERHLAPLGLTNYWGYNPIALFVPDPRLAPGGTDELRQALAAIHKAGIEVLLDVVLNHSGEGDALGPTVSLRGLDNATYYRTLAGDAARYADDTGCGNALALDRPPVLRLAMDVLRHYAAAGVDGFRFDLATTLGRRDAGFDPDAPLLQAIAQDPLLAGRKFVAEPWDLGEGGYRLGAFPAGWGEWNDRYRDTVRRYWRGDQTIAADLATRIAGSADVFAGRRRPPSRSINFVAAHDGFTLADLVSYARKHNESNGEDNRDGTNANHAWNHGVEGDTGDAQVLARRARDVRGLLATLLLSRGTPMLSMGDELGRTQHGNNNVYAQDSPVAWVDWVHADATRAQLVAELIALRRAHPALRAERWLAGRPAVDGAPPDVVWWHPDGRPMTGEDWGEPDRRLLVAVLSAVEGDAASASRIGLAFNAGEAAVAVTWPDAQRDRVWAEVIDTSLPTGKPAATAGFAGGIVEVPPRAVLVIVEEAKSPRRFRQAGVEPATLDRVAAAAGIATQWKDVRGRRHVTPPETIHAILAAMGLAARSTAEARECIAEIEATKASAAPDDAPHAPARCFLPPELAAGRRSFGLAAHLYTLRRRHDQGIGDFTTLAQVAAATARAGGVTVGLNPLHALFSQQRERASPYHPSDRRFLDPIYIDVTVAPDFSEAPEARDALAARRRAIAALSAARLVDYRRVWEVKRTVLDACFAHFSRRTPGDPLVAEFERFVAAGGPSLQNFAIFEAIAEQFPGKSSRQWPDQFLSADSPHVTTFAATHWSRVHFALYLQWLADRQLAEAARQARACGLALSFYRDLAVGAAPDGAEAWANAGATLARGVSIGAPPDPFSPAGQVWDLPPPIPRALAGNGCAAFREIVAANMRHAGALRIDHAAALARLFWVPDGANADDGTYVSYPRDALIATLAEESHRARCLVVGEDLGTLPHGFREWLDAADVLSYRILWFERDGARFLPPARYPAKAAACVSTHDLPTVAGWWNGRDIDERSALGLLDSAAGEAARAGRAADRRALAAAMVDSGSVAAGAVDPDAPHGVAITAAVHRHIARAPSLLMLLQADDLAGEAEALNLPATDRERPNWRRKLYVDADGLWETPAAVAIAPDLAATRGASTGDAGESAG
jgi:glycogen operon protein